MTFIQLYEQKKGEAGGQRPLAWLAEIAVAAVVSTDTVYQWGCGFRNPNAAAATLVAQHIGIPAAELFPTSKIARQ